MPKTISVDMPNGDSVTFPEDMPPQEIEKFILHHFPEVRYDTGGEGTIGNFAEDANQFGLSLKSLGEQAYKDPKGTAKAVAKQVGGEIAGTAEYAIPGEQELETEYADPMWRQMGEDLTSPRRHPLNFLLTGSSIVAPLARLPGRAGEVARRVSQLSNPVSMGARAGIVGAKRAITPFPAPEHKLTSSRWLEGEGVGPFTAGQVSGNRSLRWVEDAMGGRLGQDVVRDQAESFTRRASQEAGMNSLLTPQALAARYDEFNPQFQSFRYRAGPFRVNPQQFAIDAQLAWDTYASTAGGVPNPNLRNRAIALARDVNNGQFNGTKYHANRSRLAKAAQTATDPTVKRFYNDLVESLDEVAEQNIPASEMARFREIRRQYRNYVILEDASVNAKHPGLLSPSRLESAAAKGWRRRSFARGQSDFTDLAKHGREVIGDELPTTGDTARWIGPIISSGVGAAAGGLASGADAMATAAGALAARPVIGRAIQVAQPYLRNQAIPRGTTAVGRAAGDVGRAGFGITYAGERGRAEALRQAEQVLSSDVLKHAKETPELRKPLNDWLNGGDPRAFASALAKNLKVPQLEGRIYQELGALKW